MKEIAFDTLMNMVNYSETAPIKKYTLRIDNKFKAFEDTKEIVPWVESLGYEVTYC